MTGPDRRDDVDRYLAQLTVQVARLRFACLLGAALIFALVLCLISAASQ